MGGNMSNKANKNQDELLKETTSETVDTQVEDVEKPNIEPSIEVDTSKEDTVTELKPSSESEVESQETSATVSSSVLEESTPSPHEKETEGVSTKNKLSQKGILGVSIAAVLAIVVAGSYHLFSDKNTDQQQETKPKKQLTEKKQVVIYKSVLDSSHLGEEELFNATYPFGAVSIANTRQYSRSLFEKIDSIIVDPTGEFFPNTTGLLESFPSTNYGFAGIHLDLSALPKQPLFIRLVAEKEHSPFAVRHYYVSGDAASRVLSLDGLSGGKYYFQILNLITQTAYVSNTFNLTSNGIITDSTTINFIKINELDNIFRMPVEDENSALLVEDIPIVLNADINREVLDFSKSRAIREAAEE